MRFPIVASAGLLATLSLAAPASYVEHEKRDLARDPRWVKRDRAPGSARMPVRIALQQRNLEHGHDYLMDIADPASSKYGEHWTSQQVAEMFAPSQESIDAVTKWLSGSGIGADRHVVSPGKHWIHFDASLDEVESLLQTQYHVYDHEETGDEHVACDEYHVPHEVHSHIDFISPTINMRATTLKKRSVKRTSTSVASLPPINLGPSNTTGSGPSPALGAEASFSTCYQGLNPACVKAAYGIPAAPTSPQAGNELGIFEEGDYYDQPDLNSFWSKFYPAIPAGTGPILKSVDGAKAPETQQLESEEQNGEESLLDFELAFPIVYPQDVWLYQVDDAHYAVSAEGFGNTFLDALDASYCTSGGGDASIDPKYPDPAKGGYKQKEMCGAYKPTNVISVSYGLAENTFTASYTTRQCNEFMKLGLQGVSVIYASGDSGVASRSGCLPGNAFNPGYPASCPYVTSVGATMVKKGANVTNQVAVNDPQQDFWSGGGFSNVFARPSYQDTAVNTFLTQHKPPYPASTFNASGRGFPDVSAVGFNITNFDGGEQILQGGTSASAPIFASIMNLINDARLAAGKKPTGFLNPTLYANPTAFTDIISGSNPGCGTNGFSAVTGWDPVTGLGTPVYSKLLAVFMALP